MSDENKNIENNQEENQNRQECNKKWWVKTQPTGFCCCMEEKLNSKINN